MDHVTIAIGHSLLIFDITTAEFTESQRLGRRREAESKVGLQKKLYANLVGNCSFRVPTINELTRWASKMPTKVICTLC